MELGDREWIDLLSGDHPPSQESVIYTGKFRKTLRIRKDEWNRFFAGFGGIDLRPGRETELISKEEGGPKVAFPDWTVNQLALETSSMATRDAHHPRKKRVPL